MVDTTGLTKDAGWQIGVRRTIPASANAIWAALMAPAGLAIWLGPLAKLPERTGTFWQAEDGSRGDVRSYEAERLVRLTWNPASGTPETTLQLRLLPAKTGTTLAIHQERLTGPAERETMREHWKAVAKQIAEQAMATDRMPSVRSDA